MTKELPDATATTPPSDAPYVATKLHHIRERLRLNKPATLRELILMQDADILLSAFDAATVEIERLRADLARRPATERTAVYHYDGASIVLVHRRPTCPNGCDIAGPNIVYGETCDVCGARLQ